LLLGVADPKIPLLDWNRVFSRVLFHSSDFCGALHMYRLDHKFLVAFEIWIVITLPVLSLSATVVHVTLEVTSDQFLALRRLHCVACCDKEVYCNYSALL
jgi:hypothetical protein